MLKSGSMAFLLVALVAACPIQCLVFCQQCEGHDHVAVEQACSTEVSCQHEEHEEQAPPCSETPQHHHGDCVCQGALPVDCVKAELSVASLDGFWVTACPVGAAIGRTTIADSQLNSVSWVLPDVISGHSLCALTACWLN